MARGKHEAPKKHAFFGKTPQEKIAYTGEQEKEPENRLAVSESEEQRPVKQTATDFADRPSAAPAANQNTPVPKPEKVIVTPPAPAVEKPQAQAEEQPKESEHGQVVIPDVLLRDDAAVRPAASQQEEQDASVTLAVPDIMQYSSATASASEQRGRIREEQEKAPAAKAPSKGQKKKRKNGFRSFMRHYLQIWIALIIATVALTFFAVYKYQKSYTAAQISSNPDNYVAQNIYYFYPERIAFTLQRFGSTVNFVADDDTLSAAFTSALDGKTIGFTRAADFTNTSPSYEVTADNEPFAKASLTSSGTDDYGFHVWTISAVSLEDSYFSLQDITIRAPKGALVTVDGIQLSESTSTNATTVHNKLLLDYGITDDKNYGYEEYTVRCLKDNLNISVMYNGGELVRTNSDDTLYEYDGFTTQAFIDEVSPRVSEFLGVYMDYMYRQVKLDAITPYTLAESKAQEAFKNVSKDLSWSGSIKGKEVLESQVYDYAQYGDNMFAVTTYSKLHITASSEYDDEFRFDWLFVKGDDGQWYVADFVVVNG